MGFRISLPTLRMRRYLIRWRRPAADYKSPEVEHEEVPLKIPVACIDHPKECLDILKEAEFVPLNNLLEGKVQQLGRIDMEQIFRLGQASWAWNREPGQLWVRPSDVMKEPAEHIDKRRKLTPEQVEAIRAARKDGQNYEQIGKQVGVSTTQVWRIIHGESWNKNAT